jgi:hypothetical protein
LDSGIIKSCCWCSGAVTATHDLPYFVYEQTTRDLASKLTTHNHHPRRKDASAIPLDTAAEHCRRIFIDERARHGRTLFFKIFCHQVSTLCIITRVLTDTIRRPPPVVLHGPLRPAPPLASQPAPAYSAHNHQSQTSFSSTDDSLHSPLESLASHAVRGFALEHHESRDGEPRALHPAKPLHAQRCQSDKVRDGLRARCLATYV